MRCARRNVADPRAAVQAWRLPFGFGEVETMDQDDRKLAGNFVWLFAAVALGAALALPHVVPSLLGGSIKSGAAAFGIVFAACGAASTLLSRTGTLRAVAAFLLVGV